MKDKVMVATIVQYVKPEALDLGSAIKIEGGDTNCPSGNAATQNCSMYGFSAGTCFTGSGAFLTPPACNTGTGGFAT